MNQFNANLPKVHDLYEAPYASIESNGGNWVVFLMETIKGRTGNGLALYFRQNNGVREEVEMYFAHQHPNQKQADFEKEVERMLNSLD